MFSRQCSQFDFIAKMALKQKAKVRFLPFHIYATVDRNLFCQIVFCVWDWHDRHVCCTSLQRAERVVYHLRRCLLLMINNSFVRERVFYHFNEQFVSNRTGYIIFSTRSSQRFRNKHLASDLPTRTKL